jgi:hypothetical protein
LLLDPASDKNIKAVGRIIQQCALDGKAFDALSIIVDLDREGIAPFPVTVALMSIIGQKRLNRAAALVRVLECMRSTEDRVSVYQLSPHLQNRLLRELGVKEIEIGNVFLDAIPQD